MKLDVIYCELWNAWAHKAIGAISAVSAQSAMNSPRDDFAFEVACGEPGFFEQGEQPIFVIGVSREGVEVTELNRAGSPVQKYAYNNRADGQMFLFGYNRYFYEDDMTYTMGPDAPRMTKWAFADDGRYSVKSRVGREMSDVEDSERILHSEILWRPRAIFGRWRELSVVGRISPAVGDFVGVEWGDVSIDDYGRAHIDASADRYVEKITQTH